MAELNGTIQKIGGEFAQVFLPVKQRVETGQILTLLAELGIKFPESLTNNTSFNQSIDTLLLNIERMPTLLAGIINAINAEDWGQVASKTSELGQSIKAIIDSIDDLKGVLSGIDFSGEGISSTDLNNFISDFVANLVDFLLITYIESYSPEAVAFLEFFGIAERNEQNLSSTNPAILPYTEKKLHINKFLDFFDSPAELAKDLYGWGLPTFDGISMLEKLNKLFISLSFPVAYNTLPNPSLDFFLFSIAPYTTVPAGQLPGLQFLIKEKISPDASYTFSEGDWELKFQASSEIAANAGLIIQPDGKFTFTSGLAVNADASLTFTYGTSGAPLVLIGEPGGSRLEIAAVSALAGVGLKASAGKTEGVFKVQSELKGGKIVIKPGNPDGFLAKILPEDGVSVDFEILIGLSSNEGFYFQGSAGLEVVIPTHIDLGPIGVENLTIGVIPKDGDIPVNLGASIKANLGPLKAVVENMGIKTTFSFPGSGGNIGPLDVALGFKPPNGIGLSIDAGVIKGGGYLFFDFEREEYAGALELVFSEWIALKAIGLVTTKMPDGSKGFSLLVIISVEFGTGLQLGFGFTLLGVGGILGLNRSVNIDALSEGIRTGSVNSIMFPENIIENAPRIISDLRRFFPTTADIFLVGPMAKIGWGTPTLVSVSLGIILEFPTINITILGVIKVALPDENVPILRLQVNFIGRFEPQNKLLWFYAELYDSRILFITLEGGMGVLVNWGDQANFVFTVGGFHPRYSPPPLPFPEPPRLAINLLNTPVAVIRVEGYFAVTSNSVQFGARVDVRFGLSEFGIEGHFAFDALFQFNPFFFSFSLSVSFSVKVFGIGLFSVGFSGLLEGPTPWHIKGKGHIKLLFFKIKVPFEHTWGEDKNTDLPPVEVLPFLVQEINALTNWQAVLPKGRNILVSLRKLGDDAADALVLHPVGFLNISQRKVPLNLVLEKFGNQQPSDVSELSLEVAGGWAKLEDTKEQFAIGQYKKLDGSKQLSSPDFEYQNSGLKVSAAGNQLRTSKAAKRIIRYETVIIDNNFKERRRKYVIYNAVLFNHFVRGGAVSQSVLSQNYQKQVQPFKDTIQVNPQKYAVAQVQNNQPFNAQTMNFDSQASANDYRQQLINDDPNLADSLHVLPNTEINL